MPTVEELRVDISTEKAAIASINRDISKLKRIKEKRDAAQGDDKATTESALQDELSALQTEKSTLETEKSDLETELGL
jgi:ABC-type phosphate transport system auxiliary subunit